MEAQEVVEVTRSQPRGTTNRNERGSAESRRRRKVWLLEQFGNGKRARCSTCPTWLTFETITVDRWPVAGCDGGRYVRGNIRPQCAPCASAQGGELGAVRKAAQAAELWRYAIPVTLRPVV
jgi:hypothetical protein